MLLDQRVADATDELLDNSWQLSQREVWMLMVIRALF